MARRPGSIFNPYKVNFFEWLLAHPIGWVIILSAVLYFLL
jgi:hypothetical protein